MGVPSFKFQLRVSGDFAQSLQFFKKGNVGLILRAIGGPLGGQQVACYDLAALRLCAFALNSNCMVPAETWPPTSR